MTLNFWKDAANEHGVGWSPGLLWQGCAVSRCCPAQCTFCDSFAIRYFDVVGAMIRSSSQATKAPSAKRAGVSG